MSPFTAPGKWFRGNTHSHSTVSDGRVSPEERFSGYRAAGYDFLVLTDHRKVSDVSAFSDAEFLAISGSEVHPENSYGGDRYHIVAVNVREPVSDDGHPNEVIARIRAQGGEAIVCHPYWCGHTLADLAPLEGYFAVEVYNDTCELLIGKGHSEAHWDDLLDKVGPCWGIAADDAHDASADCYHAWVMVKAEHLDVERILAAFRQGHFYSTQGPELLDVRLEEEEVHLPDGRRQRIPKVVAETSPARSICFKADRSKGRNFVAAPGEPLTRAEFPIQRGEKYVRVEVSDEEGRNAWSNPVFL